MTHDPVADSYDGSRTWPLAAMESFLAGLKFLLADGPALEVGVGSGRIACPLCERGVQIVGLDISARDLDRLSPHNRVESPSEFAAVNGDANCLPFAHSAFNGI